MLAVVIGLFGCASAPAGDSAEPPAPEGPSATPTWGVVDVQAFLDAHLADIRPEPGALGEAYQALMAHAEPPCPSLAEPGNPWGPWATGLDSCTSVSGWTWRGQGVAAASCRDGRWDAGALVSFEVAGSAGEVALAGGTFQLACDEAPDAGECFGQLTGSFRFSEAAPALAEGFTSSLFVDEAWGPEGRTTSLDGGVSWPDGTLALRGVVVEDGVARGGLAVRDVGGSWFSVELPEGGSGCAPLTWGGAALGEVCVDLGPWSAPLVRMTGSCGG